MIRFLTLAFLAAFALPACATETPAPDPAIPPAEAAAKAVIEASPRHHEYAAVELPGSKSKINTFVAYPERKDKAPVVIVIHEIFGLSDWIKSVGDRLAADGFIALVPDLLSGMGPNGGGSEAYPSRDDVTKAIRALSDEDVVARLNAVRAYAAKIPSATAKFGTVGFCWGGSRSFHYAVVQPELGAAVVYYGTSPDSAALASVKAPVLGLYGGDDARVNATVPPAEAAMKTLGKTYVTHIYEGAGHGFLRNQTDRNGANLKAAQMAWPETVGFLRKNLE